MCFCNRQSEQRCFESVTGLNLSMNVVVWRGCLGTIGRGLPNAAGPVCFRRVNYTLTAYLLLNFRLIFWSLIADWLKCQTRRTKQSLMAPVSAHHVVDRCHVTHVVSQQGADLLLAPVGGRMQGCPAIHVSAVHIQLTLQQHPAHTHTHTHTRTHTQ